MSESTVAGSRRGSFQACPADEPYPGIIRRAFDSDRATMTRYEFAPGARFPQHHHPQEQVLIVEEGVVEFTVGGSTMRLGPGDWAVVAPEDEHGLQAGEEGARFLAIIVPRRESAAAYTVVA
jgi:quercetin dioxygenase-like cupin family protein